MPIVRSYTGKRITVVSARPFEEVLERFHSLVGHPEIRKFSQDMRRAASGEELEQIVEANVSEAGLMEFFRLDLGDVVQKRFGEKAGRAVRILVGNPVTMSSMAIHTPDVGSYAPVTILVDEREDGVHLSYDAMENFLSGYENEAALAIARDLDRKVIYVIEQAA